MVKFAKRSRVLAGLTTQNKREVTTMPVISRETGISKESVLSIVVALTEQLFEEDPK